MRGRRLSGAGAALLGALAVAAMLAPGAGAHPLGNLSTNQLVQVRIDERQARLGYVLDLAEIPSFQQIQRYDADGDGEIGGPTERAPLLDDILGEVSSGLGLAADGNPVPLGRPRQLELSFPPGQSGLSLTRLEAGFRARLPAGVARVEVTNAAYDGRVGWRAVQALPGEGTDVTATAPTTDPTNGLRTYPQDLLESPPDESQASFQVEPGAGAVSAPGPDIEAGDAPVAASGPGGGTEAAGAGERAASDGFAGTLTGADTGGLLIFGLLAAAFGWGALHALSPGHGKAVVAGYLVGSRGTARHALILGATVTVTHTAAVFAFGLITLAASEYILPERLYPWLGLVSGLMVIAIGFAVMRSRFRRWRAMRRAAAGPAHPHHPDPDRDHHHPHGHHHDHGHTHTHGHSHTDGAPLGFRGLIGLGISGGLVPCPSALVVLIAAISQHRVGLGMVLIGAFSLGLAATISAVGLTVLWGERLMRRLRPERRLFGGRLTGALPAISAVVIVLAGVLISYRALPELG
jgi:nickel/cobalt transporter (NicO) family protein